MTCEVRKPTCESGKLSPLVLLILTAEDENGAPCWQGGEQPAHRDTAPGRRKHVRTEAEISEFLEGRNSKVH